MKNYKYSYYNVPDIHTLRELIEEHEINDKADCTAFTFRSGREIVNKTYRQFACEVRILGQYFLIHYSRAHIGIYGENSYEWLLIYFAVVTSGNVAVPIDVGLSAEDSFDLIRRSDCAVVVYSDAYKDVAENWQEMGLQLPLLRMNDADKYIESVVQRGDRISTEYDKAIISENDIATIVYTSGTTGKSKGVVLTHKNICADIVNSCMSFKIYGGTVALLPFHHIFGLLAGIMMVYHYGYQVHINNSLKYIMKDMQEFKPQTLFLVPLYVEMFYKQIFVAVKKQGKERKIKIAMKMASILKHIGIDMRRRFFGEIINRFGGKLDYIICGGAALDPYYVKIFHQLGIEIYNGYGITECASVISVNRNRTNIVGSVGQIIPCCEVRISDDGEILVKGDNVFSKYYKDGMNTKESFLDGWYHTGDLGYMKNSSLYINGRKKNLIILSNGENISPELIEQELLQLDSVGEVLVSGEANHLIAEVYPDEHILESDYKTIVSGDIDKWNRKQPMYRRIGEIRYREMEFEKTTSRKIKR